MPRFPDSETAILVGLVEKNPLVNVDLVWSNVLVTPNSVLALAHLLKLIADRTVPLTAIDDKFLLEVCPFLRDNPVLPKTFVDLIQTTFREVGVTINFGAFAPGASATAEVRHVAVHGHIVASYKVPTYFINRPVQTSLYARRGIVVDVVALPKQLFAKAGKQ